VKSRNLILYHGLPLFVILLPLVWYAITGNYAIFKGEAGIVENMTVLFLAVAIGFCIASLLRAKRLQLSSFLQLWLFILIIGAAYFALEEISYGQHMFGWGTAEAWKELNDQVISGWTNPVVFTGSGRPSTVSLSDCWLSSSGRYCRWSKPMLSIPVK